ncbi:MAG: polysaccharide biosynthesis protein [Nanoarchaeota archaeon]
MKKNDPLIKELRNKTILITGGAGSVGSVLTKKLLEYPVRAVRVLDINEHALFQLSHSINDSRLRLLLGNICDLSRIEIAGTNVDVVFHTAAVKNIEISEFNPFETIETNITGTINMIKMTMKNKPVKFFNISTDKAVDPTTLYGSTKQIGERLVSWASTHIDSIKFSTIRFGNVIETRGNVFEIWKEQAQASIPLSITDSKMKRYFFHVDEAVDFILQCVSLSKGGEIFVPKMNLFDIKDLANEVSKNHRIIGSRKGEKLTEILISDIEKKSAIETDNMWIIK